MIPSPSRGTTSSRSRRSGGRAPPPLRGGLATGARDPGDVRPRPAVHRAESIHDLRDQERRRLREGERDDEVPPREAAITIWIDVVEMGDVVVVEGPQRLGGIGVVCPTVAFSGIAVMHRPVDKFGGDAAGHRGRQLLHPLRSLPLLSWGNG